MQRLLIRAATIAMALSLSACASVYGLTCSGAYACPGDKVMAGTQIDAALVAGATNNCSAECWMGVLAAVDFPFSFVLDLVALPYALIAR
ncbi:YceK/YidQ family lipoprotein [Uliginosibacterium sp. 31-16]|uniref:YceK/YidQ family lipoprotein n=1 Tax=Uliginosibacterium sp. 31-16 TaxID=3068315 RepID=UPI00273F81DB|nr:YceK/YidQ family lipoprotein [Uliginosibacterium sp. 31-16]MDP5241310.1 YceK/YidQ family lipoprotein [Uliginosibacterium sp. 31-16]